MVVKPELQGVGLTSQRVRDRLVERLKNKGIHDIRVLEALRNLPRHIFVDEGLASRAYEDDALPIGLGQTISQPFVVALMTQSLLECAPKKVLEIGTGSGYQAALLSLLVEQVYTVERIEELLRRARRCFRKLNLQNIRSKHDDGRMGWPEEGPYDAIIVTAAGLDVDPRLLAQLKEGGVLIAPVGAQNATQQLVRVKKTAEGFEREVMEKVSFVPLLGGLS